MPSSKDPEINRQKAAEWRLANPERHLKANREWAAKKRATDPDWVDRQRALNKKQRDKLSPEAKAARYAATKTWFTEHPGYNRDKQAESAERNPIRYMVNGAKMRAAKLGVPFDLDWRAIEIPNYCPVLGVPLKRGKVGEPRRASPSLDRLVPSLGYVQSNVRVISQEANAIKQSKSLEEMRAFVADMRVRLDRAQAVLFYLERELA
jgi:hypothetical protein